jgi:PAS domain S-box-containing protein
MNLRAKTFLIIFGLFIVAFLLMGILLTTFITQGNTERETATTRNNIVQARTIIENDEKVLENLVIDWAEWNDTFQFVQDQNKKYIDSNYVYSTFFNNRLNLAAIIDINGKVIYSQYYQWVAGKSEGTSSLELADIPEDLKSYLRSGSRLLSNPNEITTNSGLITLSESPMMVASHSILTSDGNGPIKGTLVLGRYLDAIELSRLYGIYNIAISAYKPDATDLPNDYRQALSDFSKGSPTVVQTLSDSSIAGYAFIKNLEGQPAYIIRVENNRLQYSQSRQEIIYFALSLMVFGLLFIGVVLIVLDWLVVSRISSLNSSVNNIGRKGDPSSRVSLPGKDELSGLAANINTMLSNLEKSRQLQKESEAFNSALLQDSPTPIEVINPDGTIRYINPALEKITGYSETQLINRKPPFPWWTGENTQQFFTEMQEISAGGLKKQEKHFRKPNGDSFWVETTSTSIKQDNQVKYYISSWVDISERKQAEVALKESENRFRELAELLPELVFEMDLKGNLNFVNRIAFSVFGYLNEDSGRLKLEDLIIADDRENLNRNMQNIILGENSSNTEYTALRKNGTRFPAFVHAIQIKNDFAEVTGLRGILVDITTQKEIESELRASEEFASSLLNNAPNPILVSNRDSSIRYINPALEKLTGYSSMDLIGKEAPYPWWIDNTFKALATAEEELEAKNIEKCYRKKNGELLWVTLTNNPFIENGAIQYYVGNWVDITERKKTEVALKESEEFSSSLRDNSPYPIMVINPDTSIRYINAALEKLSGYFSAELIGCKMPYPFSPLEAGQSSVQTLPANMLTSFKIESVLLKKNRDSFYVDITSTPIMKGSEINYVLSIWVDITAQKLANQQMEKLYQSEKTLREELQSEIRSRTEFTRALVHELKTPLTPIMASSELLVEELTTEPLLGLARNVHRGAENMNRRVDEMLDLARGEVGMLRVNVNPVDLVRLLHEINRYMEPHARNSGQTLTIDIPEKLPIVMADDDRVRQVLFNLISNSIKYSHAGGHVRITAHTTNRELVIEVQDTGRGMSVEDQEKLFQPYYRIEGREHLSGLGLGLALSKKLVELQNGRIWVYSKKGEGSTFSFTLPLKTEDNI